MNMNDIMVNKHDELKYLILIKENYWQYKLKSNFFLRWKKSTIINENSIKENDCFENSIRFNYNLFKSMNSLDGYPSLKKVNNNNISRSIFRYNDENSIENNYIIEKEEVNSINIWNNNTKPCKNTNFCLNGNFNKKEIAQIFKEENFNLKIKGLPKIKKPYQENMNEMNIINFQINYITKSKDMAKENPLNDKKRNYYNLLRIIKNQELEIINKHTIKIEKAEIIENGLINGNELIFQNFETKENNNQFIRNKNKKIKNIRDKNVNTIEKSNNNKRYEDNKFIINLLLLIFLILLTTAIINELNIDKF